MRMWCLISGRSVLRFTPQNLYPLQNIFSVAEVKSHVKHLFSHYTNRTQQNWNFRHSAEGAAVKIFFHIFFDISSVCSSLYKPLRASRACLSTPFSLLRWRQWAGMWCTSPGLAWLLPKDQTQVWWFPLSSPNRFCSWTILTNCFLNIPGYSFS